MTARHLEAEDPLARRIRRRLTPASAVGYLVFAVGAILCFWLAQYPQPDGSNPAQVLLLVWVIAGIAQIVVPAYWRACLLTAFASSLGYIALVLIMVPHEAGNEMFGAGIIEVAIFGFLLSMVMGIPVVMYRRARGARTRSGSEDQR